MLIDRILAFFIYLVLKLLYFTCKFQVVNAHYHLQAETTHENGGFAIAFFHQNILAGLPTQDCKTFSPLISPSRDGNLASFVVERMGYRPIRGSSSRRGQVALAEIVRAVKSGRRTAITVDGPKGPKYEAKAGVLKVSQLSSVPVLPTTFRPSSFYTINSWDSFRIPKPFSKIVIRYERPFVMPRNATKEDIESYREKLQETLIQSEQLISLT